MEPAKYRRLPVVVQAVQLTTGNRVVVADWVNKSSAAAGMEVAFLLTDYPGIVIHTLEGEMRAAVGDWVVRGVHGEFYPIKPDIFAVSYELAVSSVGGAGVVGGG